MENKYFTPDIEDIRVGYECETMPSMMHEQDDTLWRKCLSLTAHDIKEIEDQWLDIRVPYLTQEQLEAEGWKPRENNLSWKPYLDKGPYSLLYHKRLEITGPNISYLGECKDINTFRYICKLLGI